MKSKTVLAAFCVACSISIQATPAPSLCVKEQAAVKTQKRADFRIRDPFVLVDGDTYYLYESKPWSGGRGVGVRTSKDLESWSDVSPVMTLPGDIKATAIWAPEVHKYKNAYWLFVTLTFDPDPAHPIASMKQDGFAGGKLQPRGVWVFRSESPRGPFVPVKKGCVTPADWMCLDGTLWVEGGTPWMVFCHEWCQTGNGRMMAAPLSDDLSRFIAEPIELFRAADVPGGGVVTDGPFLVRDAGGQLRMIWSNFLNGTGYCVSQSTSATGSIRGPWGEHRPIYTKDGGHGMVFRTHDGGHVLTIHAPNGGNNERMQIIPVKITENGVEVCGERAS